MTFLVDRKLRTALEIEKKKIQNKNISRSDNFMSLTIPFVEKLLKIGISDYHKYFISLILTPTL
jgi:hypothetical protein